MGDEPGDMPGDTSYSMYLWIVHDYIQLSSIYKESLLFSITLLLCSM
jgi:hypothetical protein